MITVAPGADFEAYAAGFDSGLVGTLGARIRDGAGGDFLARTIAGIHEDVTVGTKGLYRRSFTAPVDAGQFWLIWDDGTTSTLEEIRVTSSVADSLTPGGRDLCTLADVKRYVPGYISDPTTDEVLQALITAESQTIHEPGGREFVAIPDTETRRFEIDDFAAHYRIIHIGDCTSLDSGEVQEEDGTTVVSVTIATDVLYRPSVRQEWEPIRDVQLVDGSPAARNLARFLPFTAASPSLAAGLPARYLQLTGVWGFPAIPENVRQACAKKVIVRYLSDVADRGTPLADSVDESNINVAALLRSAMDAIEQYRDQAIG